MLRRSGMIVLGIAIALVIGAGSYLQAAWPHGSPLSALNSRSDVSQPQSSPTVRPPEAVEKQAVLAKYCMTCHNERAKTAGLMLDKLDVTGVGAHAELWEKVVQKLRSGAMPPVGMPRPDKATYKALSTWLEVELDRAAAANPNPGQPVVHRLNRAEYTNAIRDLLAVEIEGRSLLPADESAYGFDNIADVLLLSPGLLERYMIAAQKISRLAVGATMDRAAVETYRVPLALVQDDRMTEELPFGSRGGVAIRHHFPVDGEYTVKIRLRRTFNNGVITGLDQREQIDVRLDRTRLQLFTVGGECVGSSAPACKRPPTFGAATTIPSEYERTADDGLEVRFPAKAGTRVVGITFLKRSMAVPEGAAPMRQPAALASSTDEDVEMSVNIVRIEGPFGPTGPGETASRARIFVCHPTRTADENACATKILATLARRAFRRPVTEQDVQPLISLYRAGREKGDFEAAIQFALEALLVSPDFLFRIERNPAAVAPRSAYRISDMELASRLSFFLWSSIPDDELLDLAARGKLGDPAVLERQVRRMLGDPRAAALVGNFGGQWLHLRNIRLVAPDPRVFPDFDENLRRAFERETELFLEAQLREDRSVLDLLTANYTFVNERLARFYGIPNVYGSHFRRVALTDERRLGLLGHGSILTVTSYSTRTSPVLRGKWLLENILGAPPPPPPPNVPDLDLANGTKGGELPASVRERLQQHRKNPGCASCHAQIDPLGFALENFDGVGKWRTREANASVDATGVLPDGTRFDGPAEFREALLSRHEEIVKTVTQKLLTYALGRETKFYDMPAVRSIVRDAASSEYRWSALILGIVKSVPFRMRTAQTHTALADARAQVR